MQRSWRLDSDKLTFIICQPRDETTSSTSTATPGSSSSSSSSDREKETQEEKVQITATKDDSPDRMIGDINLFLFPLDSSSSPPPSPSPSSSEAIPPPPPPQKILGEIEIMIADKSSQRKGHGKTALLIFLDYILEHWSLIGREFSSSFSSSSASSSSDSSTSFSAAVVAPQLAYLRVKVHETNVGSIRLFESVGFQRVSETANYFGEIEMRWYTTGDGDGGGHTGGEKARELPYRMEAVTESS